MTANSVPQSLEERFRHLERTVGDLARRAREGKAPNLRDLNDSGLGKVVDGQLPVYRKSTGTFIPVALAPPFSLFTVTVSTSGRWYPPVTVRVRRLFVSLRTASTSGSVDVALLRNGTSVATGSIGVGGLVVAATFDSTFTGPEVDYMQVQVTSAGVGAAGLTVQAY